MKKDMEIAEESWVILDIAHLKDQIYTEIKLSLLGEKIAGEKCVFLWLNIINLVLVSTFSHKDAV